MFELGQGCVSHERLKTIFKPDLGLLEPKVIERKKLKRPKTSLDPMNNVRG